MNDIVPSKKMISVEIFPEFNPARIENRKATVKLVLDVNPTASESASDSVDVRFIIDRSDSMNCASSPNSNQSKLDVVKQALKDIVGELHDSDKVFCVAFNNSVHLLVAHDTLSQSRREMLLKKIDLLNADRSTFFSDSVELALENSGRCVLILFTDGQSSEPHRDHSKMIQLADTIRTTGQKLIIYGTGPDYDWRFLQQLAVRAGNGSFVHHVLSVEDLKSHMKGELAFMQGTVLTDVVISGWTHGGTLKSVSRFVPVHHTLKKDDLRSDSQFLDPCGSYSDIAFINQCGALDRMRGQRFYLEIEIEPVREGVQKLLTLRVQGKDELGMRFDNQLTFEMIFTLQALTQKANPEVVKVQGFIRAEELVKEARYQDASQVYADLGQRELARQMETLHQMSLSGYGDEDVSRATTSLSAAATASVILTPEICQMMDGDGDEDDQ